MGKLKKHGIIRKTVQGLWGLAHNANFSGFVTGKIYGGPLKKFCVPGMNCYSCPGALGACPIGGMQAMFSSRHPKFAFYVLGYLSLIGVLVGRFICGWLCIFGLIQELLYKIPVKKIDLPEKVDKVLRKLKYVMLVFLVILFPIILRDELGVSFPYFCKWVCPVGMMEGGIPLLLLNKGMRSAAHALFAWKFAIMAAIVITSMFINRPFCKYICPLGAFYALFQRFSFLRIRFNEDACIDCGACSKVCKMQVDPTVTPNSTECIRCGDCINACPVSALKFSMGLKNEEKAKDKVAHQGDPA